ncbi:related to transcription initiation factor IID beta chain [Cephalotrichum gorgonifer]|uniref:Related to transcription initiation factor IID beta chain n=1 Tax=Cephalotrichum gorgonifer TaxID=2041049 RepID=A0AAE8MU53_9PEZI|nr:related to transcription initiation factor IID beta chain [Cephalotrichum gorgonifer]
MASPPNYAHSPTASSPPYQTPQMTASKKRTASDLSGPAPPSLKRRKASNLSVSSTSAHPLRQTSFPPEAADAARRSPSVDDASIVSGSAVSGPAKKKRGRKAKNADASSKEATPSLVGGRSGGGSGGAAEKERRAAEDEDDEANAMEMEGGQSEEQKNEERRLRGVLAQALDRVQYDRYERWRAVRIPEAAVRRLINTTVSQSVPQNAVLLTKLIAKVFLGDIIEGARRVQGEWIEATGESQCDLPTPPLAPGVEPPERKSDQPRGPLRPEHLQEAVRRYKASGEGASVGMLGLWNAQQGSGVERFSTKNSRRIFR